MRPGKKRGRKPRAEVTDEAIIESYKTIGSINGVVKALQVNWPRVAEVVDKHGLARMKGPGPMKRLSIETKRAIQEAMLSGERKPGDVAQEFDVHVSTVRNVCREELP